MLLVVNVGNTNIRFGVFQGARLGKAFCLPTPPVLPHAPWQRRLARELSAWGKREAWEGVMAATVVPNLRPGLDKILQALTKRRVRWVTSRTPMPVKNAYRPPQSLGVDRLLNAVAAWEEFGAPVIIIDAGTAITVDAVDARAVFLGGAILPGLKLSLNCLVQGTALLPGVALRKPASLLGRSTADGLRAGIVGGTAGALAHLVAGLRRAVGRRAAVIGTGGALERGAWDFPGVRTVRPHLALFGLQRLWQKNRGTVPQGPAR